MRRKESPMHFASWNPNRTYLDEKTWERTEKYGHAPESQRSGSSTTTSEAWEEEKRLREAREKYEEQCRYNKDHFVENPYMHCDR
jgi:hypothetical protein